MMDFWNIPVTLCTLFALTIFFADLANAQQPGTESLSLSGVIAVSCVGGFLLLVLCLATGVYLYRRAERHYSRKRKHSKLNGEVVQNGTVKPPLSHPGTPVHMVYKPPNLTKSATHPNVYNLAQANSTVPPPPPTPLTKVIIPPHPVMRRYYADPGRYKQILTVPPVRLATYRPKVLQGSFTPYDVRGAFSDIYPDGIKHQRETTAPPFYRTPYDSSHFEWTAVGEEKKQSDSRKYEEMGDSIWLGEEDPLSLLRESNKGQDENRNDDVPLGLPVIVDYVLFQEQRETFPPPPKVTEITNNYERPETQTQTLKIDDDQTYSESEEEDWTVSYARRQRRPREGSISSPHDSICHDKHK